MMTEKHLEEKIIHWRKTLEKSLPFIELNYLEKVPSYIYLEFSTESEEEALRKIYFHHMETYKEPKSGRNRDVFEIDGFVIKIPVNEKGIGDNYYEAEAYPKDPERLAWCQLHEIQGLPILVMETVIEWNFFPNKSCDDFPEWTSSIDCLQVGYTIDERLVAYDYGIN